MTGRFQKIITGKNICKNYCSASALYENTLSLEFIPSLISADKESREGIKSLE
jgi:hypothetical protein